MMGKSFFVGCIEYSKKAKQYNSTSIAFCKQKAVKFMEEMNSVSSPEEDEEIDEDTSVASVRKFTM